MRYHDNTMASSNKPPPAEIEYKNMKFLIVNNPDKHTVESFIQELKNRGIKYVVRVCEPTYDANKLAKEGIQVLDLPFDDGGPPTTDIIGQWFDLLRSNFAEIPGCCIAVHCVAGLGRAPVLVALALMEAGMSYSDAVQLIRQKRRGAINARQLDFLEKYRSKKRLKMNGEKCCIQ
ncbi:protein tyrosine phosphatase type IVA 1-like isoform X1 [Anneissia japonica]|uniref:protein tyrosine phosphatase type IVA 1-like isoform X1 n=2 Tax=Anneissia japonica TaxID=1529436 RepID=UPI001425A239|nr:protein tyrosine phosphatase type IVA 1-like isoform X1 [Anneissia japonica]XP_033109076.1 protein tyrosine phosphatase type IVA 1-like isoform X1 [Anneissia japonica]